RRADGHRHRGDAERRRDSRARPPEFFYERLEQDAERVDEERGAADEHANARGDGHAPTLIARVCLAFESGHLVIWSSGHRLEIDQIFELIRNDQMTR